jgi:hypothetical protein
LNFFAIQSACPTACRARAIAGADVSPARIWLVTWFVVIVVGLADDAILATLQATLSMHFFTKSLPWAMKRFGNTK